MTLRERLKALSAAADRRLGFIQERRRFRRDVGYTPDLRQPRSFNEKVFWRKLYDHDPRFPRINCKLGMRDYLRGLLGEAAEPHLLPVQQVIERAADLDVASLPEACVLKPAHSSGELRMLRPGDARDPEALRALCHRWLTAPPFGDRHHEWLYRKIPPRVLVEPLLDDGHGRPPPDYKLFVFHGRVRLIQVDLDRFEGHRRSLFSPEWEHLPIRYEYSPGPDLDPPPALDRMMALAEAAAAEFDFLRVDLYNRAGDIHFGELTCYPASGRGRFTPVEYDYRLGEWWRLSPGA